MRLKLPLMRGLAMACGVLIVSGCGTPASMRPSADDLRVEPKPTPTLAVLSSEQAHKEYDAAIEAWGERANRKVGRLCRHAVNTGYKLPFTCSLPPPDS